MDEFDVDKDGTIDKKEMYDFIQKIVQKNPEANPTSSAKKGKNGKKKKG